MSNHHQDTLGNFRIPLDEEYKSNNIKIDKKSFHTMIFIWNALEKGWKVKKSNDSYIFTKKHENLCEIFQESYLEKFLFSNV
jgi:hypothetical protein